MKSKPHESPECRCKPCEEWRTETGIAQLFDDFIVEYVEHAEAMEAVASAYRDLVEKTMAECCELVGLNSSALVSAHGSAAALRTLHDVTISGIRAGLGSGGSD